MSREIVIAVQEPFQHAFSLLEAFIDVCPEAIWKETNGGWPVWQQVYHALTALDFFVRPPDAPELETPLSPAIGRLMETNAETLSQEQAKTFAATAKLRAETYIAALVDTDLARSNTGLSQRMDKEISHGATLGMLAAHTLYHVGSGDAALRDHGLKGVF